MKIAVTYDNGNVYGHFGHTEQFKIYEAENGKVVNASVIPTNGTGHGALAEFLSAMGTDTLICGGIGGGARAALGSVGITIYAGVSGDADEAVKAFLGGTLAFDPDAECAHHSGEAHDCNGGNHDCGHGCSH